MRYGINLNLLYGKVRAVGLGADFRVRVVDKGEDLLVRKIPSGAKAPGEWEMVENGEKFTIAFVNIGEDFKIRYAT